MRSITKVVRRILASQKGVAMVEFAFAVPILIFATLAGLELTNLMAVHMRLTQIAMTVADNAGRVNTSIDEANIYEVFAGAELIGANLDFANKGRIVLSSLEPNGLTGSSAGQMINWQRCHGSLPIAPKYGYQGTGRTNASLASGMGPANNRITAESGTAVMFVELTYRYTPLIFAGIGGQRDIRYERAMNVRERTNQAITNSQSLPLKSCT